MLLQRELRGTSILKLMEYWRTISDGGKSAGDKNARPQGGSSYAARTRSQALPFLVLFLACMSGGCPTANKPAAPAEPVIEFTRVPVAGADNPARVSSIEGRVTGAKPGQHIVLYARGETTWWVQPFANQPFTAIQDDATWSNATHPGKEYAALLVGPDFRPPLTADSLPTAGVFGTAISKGERPLWFRWWFLLACAISAALAVFGVYRLRLYQLTSKMNLRFEERLAERMRVAQELHDTLLQGMISASMQLHVAVDQLPGDSPVQPVLHRVLQLMSQVIEEGRNTLRGLRSSGESGSDMEHAFLRIQQELGVDEKVAFRVVVEGAPLPLRATIRDDVYSIGREALVNAFRHSGGSNIEVELEYAAGKMRVLVRDNGCGIDPQVLRSGRDGHWGLSGMRERAERIGAVLRVLSGASAGTEIELSIPGNLAFESPSGNKRSRWLSKLPAKRMQEPKVQGVSEQ